MKIQTLKLRDALNVVKPGLANKEILEQTTSFAFLKGRIVTYNDEISISHPFDTPFQGAVKAEELYGLLSKVTKDEVDLVIEGTELLVTSGRTKAGLRLEAEISLPLKELPKKMDALPNGKQFCEFVGFAMKTCSNDTSQPKLTCVSISPNGDIVGSDGYRLLYCKGEPLPISHFLLPAANAAEVVKINPTHISLDKGWVHFKNKEGTYISCRRLDDDYVPIDQVAEVLKFNSIGKVEFPERIGEIIDRVHQFAKRDSFLDEKVNVTIRGNKVLLKATSEVTNSWIEEQASLKCDADVTFVISPSLFQDIVHLTRAATFDKSLQKMKFKGEGWSYVLMLRTAV